MDNGTQFKGAKFARCYTDFGIHHQASSAAHPQTNGQVKQANGLILQGMKTRMFHDIEARGRNWHREVLSVLWALQTNINRATRDTPFHLVYGVDTVLRVAHINEEDQAEGRELDSNLLEEKRNTTLANVQKYQESLKRYYNKSVVSRELNIGDLVLKKDIRTKDKYKFSLPWEGPLIIVDIAAPWAYVLAEVNGGMLPNTWNVDQLHKYCA
jgi:transposase InsO family protein